MKCLAHGIDNCSICCLQSGTSYPGIWHWVTNSRTVNAETVLADLKILLDRAIAAGNYATAHDLSKAMLIVADWRSTL